MSYSKQSLVEAKKKLREKDPSFFNNRSASNISRKQLIKSSSQERKKKIVKEDRADSILFGCMTMSFAGLEKRLEKEIGIPVLNAGRVALKTIESMISMDISHSDTAYPYPVKLKKIKNNKLKITK